MVEQKRRKSLSSDTRRFLASGEGQLVDFKRTPDSITMDDLVAFANSTTGGAILAGVDEKNVDGAQVGVILGCNVSDHTILQLLNKAISCLPPISIDVVIENLSEKPILRVSVPSSPTKPHCTPKGIYCQRDGARNRALHPSELLRIFLETEARAFEERFQSAAVRISEELGSLEASLSSTIESMSNQLGWAESNLDDTSNSIDTILAYAKHLNDETGDVATRLRELFRQDARQDPIRDREMKKLTEQLVEQISEDDSLIKSVLANRPLSYQMQGKPARELTVEDGQAALVEAAKVIREREDLKNYRVNCVSPTECTPETMDTIVAAIAGGRDPAQLRRDILKAFRIGYTTYKDNVVAVAGLRKPRAASRAMLFERMKTSADAKIFKIQLDWLHLHPDHREKGQLTRLLTKLLSQAKGKPLFAVVSSDDKLAREVLLQFKFKPESAPGETSDRAEAAIQLYLRDGV